MSALGGLENESSRTFLNLLKLVYAVSSSASLMTSLDWVGVNKQLHVTFAC